MKKEKKEEKPKKFKLPPKQYDILYITNKYKVSEYAVANLAKDMELGKHYKLQEGRLKFTQVGLMRVGRGIKRKRANGEDLDLIQTGEGQNVVQAIQIKKCINERYIECMLNDEKIVVTAKKNIRDNFRMNKPLLVEKLPDGVYIAPPMISG